MELKANGFYFRLKKVDGFRGIITIYFLGLIWEFKWMQAIGPIVSASICYYSRRGCYFSRHFQADIYVPFNHFQLQIGEPEKSPRDLDIQSIYKRMGIRFEKLEG